MHIGIVVHSQSGHTAAFAKAIAEKFRQNGHEADTVLLLTSGLAKPSSRRFTISNAPSDQEIASYDALLVGGPVWSFKASPVITKYITSMMGDLKGKKALAFVTFGLFGQARALFRMGRLLEKANGTVLAGEALRYLFKFNAKKLNEAVDRIYNRLLAD